MTFDITFFAVAVPAVILTGISKGGFAGMGSMAVPILSLIMLPTMATALMLPILCLMDVIALWTYWGKWHALNMRILVVAGVIGIAIGTITFRYLHPEAIRIMIGVIAVVFALRHWLRSSAATREPTQPSIAKGGFWGTIAGFTSFVSHAGAPPVAIYLLPQRLDKTVYQATTVTLFLAVNYAKIGPYYFLDLFTRESLLATASLLPVAVVGIFLGVWLHHRVPEKWFFRIAYAALFLIGTKLLIDGTTALLA
ncbi:MAG: sulfite exporter TauE/SafE family protein [Alphaproteobacteria bacterium]|nr:sulfite exporter TauE/SafE family protein [Alphaproteobacteria bacterium]